MPNCVADSSVISCFRGTLVAWVDAAPTWDDVFIKGMLMLHLSSLAGLFSEEHSIGISDWSCGKVGAAC